MQIDLHDGYSGQRLIFEVLDIIHLANAAQRWTALYRSRPIVEVVEKFVALPRAGESEA